MKKKILVLIVTISLSLSLWNPSLIRAKEIVTYNDSNSIASWAANAVSFAAQNNIMNGYNGAFSPKNNLSRGEIAKIMAVSLGLVGEGLDLKQVGKTKFSDINGHWADPYIKLIMDYDSEILKGYTDGTFKPNAQIRRDELSKVIVVAYDMEKEPGIEVSFNDSNNWAKTYIETLASKGIVLGSGSGNFSPEAPVTRESVAVFVHRTMDESERIPPVSQKPTLTIEENIKLNRLISDAKAYEVRTYFELLEVNGESDKTIIELQLARSLKNKEKEAIATEELEGLSDRAVILYIQSKAYYDQLNNWLGSQAIRDLDRENIEVAIRVISPYISTLSELVAKIAEELNYVSPEQPFFNLTNIKVEEPAKWKDNKIHVPFEYEWKHFTFYYSDFITVPKEDERLLLKAKVEGEWITIGFSYLLSEDDLFKEVQFFMYPEDELDTGEYELKVVLEDYLTGTQEDYAISNLTKTLTNTNLPKLVVGERPWNEFSNSVKYSSTFTKWSDDFKSKSENDVRIDTSSNNVVWTAKFSNPFYMLSSKFKEEIERQLAALHYESGLITEVSFNGKKYRWNESSSVITSSQWKNGEQQLADVVYDSWKKEITVAVGLTEADWNNPQLISQNKLQQLQEYLNGSSLEFEVVWKNQKEILQLKQIVSSDLRTYYPSNSEQLHMILNEFEDDSPIYLDLTGYTWLEELNIFTNYEHTIFITGDFSWNTATISAPNVDVYVTERAKNIGSLVLKQLENRHVYILPLAEIKSLSLTDTSNTRIYLQEGSEVSEVFVRGYTNLDYSYIEINTPLREISVFRDAKVNVVFNKIVEDVIANSRSRLHMVLPEISSVRTLTNESDFTSMQGEGTIDRVLGGAVRFVHQYSPLTIVEDTTSKELVFYQKVTNKHLQSTTLVAPHATQAFLNATFKIQNIAREKGMLYVSSSAVPATLSVEEVPLAIELLVLEAKKQQGVKMYSDAVYWNWNKYVTTNLHSNGSFNNNIMSPQVFSVLAGNSETFKVNVSVNNQEATLELRLVDNQVITKLVN